MKSPIKSAWLVMGLAAALNVVIPQVRGAAVPPSFSDGSAANVSTAGRDGNFRLLFDLFTNVTLTSTSSTVSGFLGQTIWVLDPIGRFLTAGIVPIPNTISASYVQGQRDGNTTVLFTFPNESFGVWTYNRSGAVIASALYGPFGGTVISDVKRQEVTGRFLVEWTSTAGTGQAFSAWTVNEFGGIDTAAGPYGPFANTSAPGITLLDNGNQEWVWGTSGSSSTSGVTTAVWTIAPGGQFLAVNTYGPF